MAENEKMEGTLQQLLDIVKQQLTIQQQVSTHETRISLLEQGLTNLREVPDKLGKLSESIAGLVKDFGYITKSLQETQAAGRQSERKLDQASGATISFKTVIPWILTLASIATAVYYAKGR